MSGQGQAKQQEQGQGQQGKQEQWKQPQQLLRSATQAQEVGATRPPSMHTIPDDMLTAASPVGFNLLTTTKVDSRHADTAAASCRAYNGITGLRQLQADQANHSQGQPGCGWIYKPSTGMNPEINRGSFGTAKGPIVDSVASGSTWYWDLAKAEKDISTAICNSASSCASLALMGQYSNVCGYCKTSGKVIPIQVDTAGNAKARYPKSAMCAPESIVKTSGKCPPPSSSSSAGATEGFAGSMDALTQCSSPLSRDCVLLAARMAGCSDSGSLITALGKAPNGKDYDSAMASSAAYTTYQRYSNPAITRSVMKDGSASIGTALNDFGNLLTAVDSPDTKLGLAARDLCFSANAFDAYDFCSEMTPTTLISSSNIACVQKHWLNMGGTMKGRKYPTLGQWSGKSYQSYITMASGAISTLNAVASASSTREGFKNQGTREGFSARANAILDVIGIDTSVSTSAFPRSELNRGTEVVWIDMTGPAPTILGCSLNLTSSLGTGVVPSIGYGPTTTFLYGTPPANYTFILASELRPDTDLSLSYMINTRGSLMLGMGQNPFEGTKYALNDWGSWAASGSSPAYQSRPYTITAEADQPQPTNTLVLKVTNSGNAPEFLFRAYTYVTQNGSTTGTPQDTSQFMYLTQEAAAPWLQFEVCNRPSSAGVTRVGFNEVRFNGPANSKGAPSFDTTTSAIDVQTNDWYRSEVPMKKACISFPGVTSTWRTAANYAFGGFKTITLLARPTASLADGASCRLFSHLAKNEAGQTMGSALAISRSGQTYYLTNGAVTAPIAMNTWNLIVIQYIHNTAGTGIVTHSFVHDTLPNLQTVTAQKKMLTSLAQIQTLSSTSTAWPATMAGTLMLGAVDMGNGQACVGDVAWLHGFRDYFTTSDVLLKEIKQSWITRWPRGADIPGQPQSGQPAAPAPAAADPLAGCKLGASQGSFVRHPNGFIGWNPAGSSVINPLASCQVGRCPGQKESACGNFKQLTPEQFGKYAHCPNYFDCSMMAVPAGPGASAPAPAAQGNCKSWTQIANMNIPTPLCPPGARGSLGPGRCHTADLASAQAACTANAKCAGVVLDGAGYEPRDASQPMMLWNGVTSWKCNTNEGPAPPLPVASWETLRQMYFFK